MGAIIEKGIPMPTDRRQVVGSSATLRELARADIGDSIFVPECELNSGKQRRPVEILKGRIHSAAGPRWATVRAVEGGFRVWKTDEPSRAVQP